MFCSYIRIFRVCLKCRLWVRKCGLQVGKCGSQMQDEGQFGKKMRVSWERNAGQLEHNACHSYLQEEAMYHLGSIWSLSWCPSKKYQCLISNRTKAFCSIFRISSILDEAYLQLDFEIKIVEIHRMLSEIHYLKVEHSKFGHINLKLFKAITASQSCFHGFLAILISLAFFQKWGDKQYTKAVKKYNDYVTSVKKNAAILTKK